MNYLTEKADETSFAGAMLKASSIIFILIFIQRVFGYLLNSLLTKSISQTDYGSYTFAWSISMFATGILLLGISSATARYVAYYRGGGNFDMVKSIIKTGFLFNSGLLGMLLILLIVVNILFPNVLSLNNYLFIFICSVFVIHGTGSFFSSIISGYRKPEISSVFGTLFPVLSFVFAAIAIFLTGEFMHILFAIALAFLISNILNITYALKNYGLAGKFRPGLIKDLLKFGVSVVFIDTANNLLSWADVFIIKMYIDFSDVGVYWASVITANTILMFFIPINSIFAPIAAELFGKRDIERLNLMTSYIIERFFLISLPIIFVFLIFPKGILSIIFTAEYMAGALPLQILVISTSMLGLSLLFRTILTASGKPYIEARVIVIAAVANVVLNIILIKPYGIVGASLATLCSSAVILAFAFRYARREVAVKINLFNLVKISGSLVIPLILVYIVKLMFASLFFEFVVSSFVIVVFYLGSLVVVKAFRDEDIMLVGMILGALHMPRRVDEFVLGVVRRGVS